MTEPHSPHAQAQGPQPPPKWPRFVLLGVILFFVVSTLWLLAFVERVRRIRDSTAEMTNSAPAPASAPQQHSGPPP